MSKTTKDDGMTVDDSIASTTAPPLKRCFIVTPIGGDSTEIRRKTDGLLDAVISPVLDEHGYDCVVSHREYASGSISREIVKHLLEDELVIANLTGLNPNVMYELAIRHAKQLPVIQIAESGTKLPFDVQDQRTLSYTDDMAGVEKLKDDLRHAVSKSEESEAVSNLIVTVLNEIKMEMILESNNFSGGHEISDVLKIFTSEIASLRNTIDKNIKRDNFRTRRNTLCLRGPENRINDFLNVFNSECTYGKSKASARLYNIGKNHFHIRSAYPQTELVMSSILDKANNIDGVFAHWI